MIADANYMISCACGCGEQFMRLDSKYRIREFSAGHATRTRIYETGHFDYLKGNKFREGKTPWNKGKLWPEKMGENNPAWRGGTSFKRGSRWDTRYKQWRKAVFARDNSTCVHCGIENPKPIHADHIKSWKDYVGLRFDISNGRTLCWDCHKKTPTYGYRKEMSHGI